MTHAAGLQVNTASAAFDDLAESYDDSFTHLPVGRAQRRAVWDTLQSVFRSGNRILELNCGTGEDALFLSRQGVSVVACDASPRMIEVARRRIASENHPSPVEYHVLRTEDLSRLQSTLPFDGVLSNFSGLNCVEDLRAVALGLAPLTKPGAPVCICLSSRFCLWEFFWFILHADVRSAFRRIWGASIARVGGHSVQIWYPTIRAMRRCFSPWFRLRSIRAVGLSIPPSYVRSPAITRPSVIARMEKLDRRCGQWPIFRAVGDHVLLQFERTAR